MSVGSPPRKLVRTKRDPKMRRDRTCFVCRNPLPLLSIQNGDSFCSVQCVWEYYGTKPGSKASTS